MAEFYQQFCRETFDDKGMLQSCTIQMPPGFNYGYDVADALGEQYPQRLALLWRNDRGQEKRLTFGELKQRSNQAANVLAQAGLGRGDVLLVCLRSHWEYWVVALAAHKLGLVLSPVYWRLTEEDLALRMEMARGKGVITCRDGETAQTVLAAAKRAGVSIRFAIGGEEAGFQDFSGLMEGATDHLDRVKTDPADPILLYFTSGTTGRPKGVLHDQAYTLASHYGARYMQDVHAGSLHFATGDTGWEVVSGTKFYGQWLNLGALLVFDYDRFPTEKVLSCLAADGATSIMAQPTVYRMMTDVGMDQYELSAVTCCAVGGEKLSPDLAERVERQMGQPLYEGYAQSEAGLIAANSKNMGRKAGSVGKILPKYHVELVQEDGTFAADGQLGEIVLVADGGRRPMGLLMGYLDDPEATERIWDGDLFHTGDWAIRDGEGFLFYQGRSDGMIKTKGYRVSPVEVEGVLSRHPAVAECIVVGIPDRDLGQKIRAYVQCVPGQKAGEALGEALMAFHNRNCAGYRKIREVRFVEKFDRNANGKLLRNQFETQD